jgi:ornithine cyclodeaminase/alanine dehydrogenase-like protein (mu-crystallin family)
VPTIKGIVNLVDNMTGALTALIDFHLVTMWKTAGDSLLSASRRTRKDSRNIFMVAAGVVAQQGRGLLHRLPRRALHHLEPDPQDGCSDGAAHRR